jgi:hypothetical protein
VIHKVCALGRESRGLFGRSELQSQGDWVVPWCGVSQRVLVSVTDRRGARVSPRC